MMIRGHFYPMICGHLDLILTNPRWKILLDPDERRLECHAFLNHAHQPFLDAWGTV
jgi:hypothetical protein